MKLPPPLAAPPKPGLFRRTPPAIFPAILGLLGLGVAWRAGHAAFGIPVAPVEGYLGAVVLLFLFAAIAYGGKLMRRPGVVAEDIATLPGRSGFAAFTMCLMLLGAILVPYQPEIARMAVFAGLLGHVLVALWVSKTFLTAPTEARQITPVMHLVYVGFIVAPAALVPLGHDGISNALIWYCLAASLTLCLFTLGPLIRKTEPPPLRPLHAIHLAPTGLIASSAFLTGQTGLGTAMMVWGTATFVLLAIRARWMMEAGFSGFWSAFTFPLAAFAGAWFAAAAVMGWDGARIAGGLVLVAATLIIPPIGFKVMQLWAKGTLAAKTNAAEA